jgi:hypothetical protein
MSEPTTPRELSNLFEPPEEGVQTLDSQDTGSKQPQMEAPLDGVDLMDHSQEEAARRKAEDDAGVAPPDMPETKEFFTGKNRVVDTDAVDILQQEMQRRFQDATAVPAVEVSQDERDDFMRALLHDAALSFDVDVAGLTFRVVLPPEDFTMAAAAAAGEWAEQGFNSPTSDLQWALSFQQMHAWWQIRAVNNDPAPWVGDADYESMTSAQIREFLRRPENLEPVRRVSLVRWRAMVDAMRIAEAKYRICLRNLHDRSFFTGADTA